MNEAEKDQRIAALESSMRCVIGFLRRSSNTLMQGPFTEEGQILADAGITFKEAADAMQEVLDD